LFQGLTFAAEKAKIKTLKQVQGDGSGWEFRRRKLP